ncbi:MAG: SDR family oxidoreductase [Verrucomicrobia bacterium]|nr:SDR family oxidoreductase [Verrucomicrobiota bacterium]
MKNYVKDKVIIITGGSSGFGLSAAEMLLEMGGKVVITGRDAARLKAAEKQLNHKDLLAAQADAVKTGDWKKLVEQTVGKFGRIDVLVNNHGAGVKIANVEDMDDENLEAVLDINLTSIIRGCREVIPTMRAGKRGHIINVSSGCAYHAWPKWAVYTAAKAGMVVFTRSLHLEMAEWGGKATSFIPGAAKTGFCAAAKIDDSWQEGYPVAEDFARSLVHCIDVPDNTVIEEVNVWGTKQVKDMLVPY